MVELALALPMMLLLIFGAVEFGTAMYDKAVITNASREGARFGIVATIAAQDQSPDPGRRQQLLQDARHQLQEDRRRHRGHHDHLPGARAHELHAPRSGRPVC